VSEGFPDGSQGATFTEWPDIPRSQLELTKPKAMSCERVMIDHNSAHDQKANDLSSQFCDINGLQNLPFAMPKLELRLQESKKSMINLSIPKSSLAEQNEDISRVKDFSSDFDLRNSPGKVTRPSSLIKKDSDQFKPAPLQLKIPLQRPGKAKPGLHLNINSGGRIGSPALAPSSAPLKRKPLLFLTPTLNLSQSVDVDTSVPLVRQDWYHGVLSRVEAEKILKPHSEGSYLVRATLDQSRTEYSLAIKSSAGSCTCESVERTVWRTEPTDWGSSIRNSTPWWIW